MADGSPFKECSNFQKSATKPPHLENEDASDDDQYAVTESSSSEEDNPCGNVMEEKENVVEEFKKESSVKENGRNVDTEMLPSAVLDKDFIYMPLSSEHLEETEEWKSGGKWLLFSHGDMEKLDYLWTNLRPLLADSTLLSLKFSTGTDPVEGVIMCYTTDCDDRKGVKKAADAISNVASPNYIIYYKTNEASDAGIYARSGNKFISKYMYSVAGSLYERDEHNRWKKVLFGQEN